MLPSGEQSEEQRDVMRGGLRSPWNPMHIQAECEQKQEHEKRHGSRAGHVRTGQYISCEAQCSGLAWEHWSKS